MKKEDFKEKFKEFMDSLGYHTYDLRVVLDETEITFQGSAKKKSESVQEDESVCGN